jgi:hypothetical protein
VNEPQDDVTPATEPCKIVRWGAKDIGDDPQWKWYGIVQDEIELATGARPPSILELFSGLPTLERKQKKSVKGDVTGVVITPVT